MGNTSASVSIVPAEVRDEIEKHFATNELDLPLLPRVAMEVLQLCRSPNADAKRLSDILHQDQAIAGNVLRVANSPLCGSSVRITSLQQAVSRLGFRTLSDVVVAISLNTRAFEIPARWHDGLFDHDLRRKSFLTALFAKEVARVRRSNVESAFLLGLLHDMGIPVLCMLLRELDDRRNLNLSIVSVGAAVQVFHPEVGARLCEAWGLPAELAEAIRHQSDWTELEDPPEDCALIQLADQLATLALSADHDPAGTAAKLDPEVLAALNLYPDEAAALLELRNTLLEVLEVML